MRKKIVVLLTVALLLAVMLLTLVACNSEMDYVKRLYEKEYTNIYIDKTTDVDGYTLITCGTREMIAEMGGYIEVYNNKGDAKTRYEQIKDSYPNIVLDGSAVVYGFNEQFVNDAIGK